jgi:mRNA interferase MazF
MVKVSRFEIWIANMNPGFGTEPGKIRPVVIVQSNLLNKLGYPSTIVCPLSSQKAGVSLIRIPVAPSEENGLQKPSSVIVDQITGIDLSRLQTKIGVLEEPYRKQLQESIIDILDLENY